MRLTMPQSIRYAAALALLTASTLMWAHRQPVSWSHLVWQTADANTAALEITHRLHYHDAADLMRQAGHTNFDLALASDQNKLLALIADHVDILALDATPIKVATLGAEIEGNHILIYQEAETAAATGLQIKVVLLQDLTNAAQQYVNVDVAPNSGIPGPARDIVTKNFVRSSYTFTIHTAHARITRTAGS